MESVGVTLDPQEKKLYSIAFILSLVTLGYNLLEGLISVFFGIEDESLVLFGFGADSFIEVISAAGITHMISRIRGNPFVQKDKFEITALKITGTAFYILATALVITVAYNLYIGHQPESTFWGTIISIISIFTMGILIYLKMNVGKKLNSEPIISDAKCTQACLYMSLVLLVSNLLYEFTGIGYIDSIGTLGIIYFSLKEGKESFEKAKGKSCSCSSCH